MLLMRLSFGHTINHIYIGYELVMYGSFNKQLLPAPYLLRGNYLLELVAVR